MFDDLFDILDRDRRGSTSRRSSKRGLHGLIDRLAGEHDDDDHARRPYRHPNRDDDELGRRDRSSRRQRERDQFDGDD